MLSLLSIVNHIFDVLFCCPQIDLHAEEMENNVPAEVALLGDLKSVAEQVQRHCLV